LIDRDAIHTARLHEVGNVPTVSKMGGKDQLEEVRLRRLNTGA